MIFPAFHVSSKFVASKQQKQATVGFWTQIFKQKNIKISEKWNWVIPLIFLRFMIAKKNISTGKSKKKFLTVYFGLFFYGNFVQNLAVACFCCFKATCWKTKFLQGNPNFLFRFFHLASQLAIIRRQIFFIDRSFKSAGKGLWITSVFHHTFSIGWTIIKSK